MMRMFNDDAALWDLKDNIAKLARRNKMTTIIICAAGVIIAVAVVALLVMKFCKRYGNYECFDCYCDDDDIDELDDYEEDDHAMEHGLDSPTE